MMSNTLFKTGDIVEFDLDTKQRGLVITGVKRSDLITRLKFLKVYWFHTKKVETVYTYHYLTIIS